MADYNLSPVFQDEQFSDDVLPLVGGTLTWYLAGTTTPATVYQTSTGTAHTAPIVLNSRGEPPAPIWLANGTVYKCVLADADAVTIRTIDNIVGVGDTTAFPSTFTEITIDSTGNGALIWQDAAGDLAIQSNQASGAQNNVNISSTKTASDKPIVAPGLRIGDTTVPTLPVEIIGNAYINGALRVGDTTTPTQKLEVAGNITATGDVSPGGLGAVRYRLTAPVAYYVRTNGNDANNGLADTAGGAFRTIQRAIDVVAGTLDLGYQTVTIYVRAGTYAAFYLRSLTGCSNAAYSVTIEGDLVTPGNVVVTSSTNTITGDTIEASYRIRGMRIASSGGAGILMYNAGCTLDTVEFGACVNGQIVARYGSQVFIAGNYAIVGNAPYHFYVDTAACIAAPGAVAVTLTGTPAFSSAFVSAAYNGTLFLPAVTWTGSATGTRYAVAYNSVVYAAGVTFPGSVAGGTTTGGQIG
jgi:hypothetical protein